MKFILVTAKWKDNMIAFYRKMWVREDISLVKFGYQLTKIIKAKFSHMFFLRQSMRRNTMLMNYGSISRKMQKTIVNSIFLMN